MSPEPIAARRRLVPRALLRALEGYCGIAPLSKYLSSLAALTTHCQDEGNDMSMQAFEAMLHDDRDVNFWATSADLLHHLAQAQILLTMSSRPLHLFKIPESSPWSKNYIERSSNKE